MTEKKKIVDFFTPVTAMGVLFIITDLLALLITRPFESAGIAAFADPNDPFNIIYLFVMLFISTILLLLIAKFGKKQLIRCIVLASTGLLIFNTVFPLATIFMQETWALLLSLISGIFLVTILVKYPEWYIVDACCILVGAGASAMLGVSLSIKLVIVMLAGLAIYDAISVYKTKHMIYLADALLDLKLPVLLIIPRIRKYSLIKDPKSLKERTDKLGTRDTFIMGLGDIVLPSILVTSSFYNLPTNGLLVALSVMTGTLLGFIFLIFYVAKRKPQAGLPFLCGGAIVGYFLSTYIMLGKLVFL